MGQERSIFSRKSRNTIEMLSMTWVQFVKLICELNDRCAKFVDPDGRYLLFAIKKGSANTLLWKMTVRICTLKINARSADSYRVFTFGQFLSLQKSLCYLLRDVAGETDGAILQERVFDTYIDRALTTSECIICMEREPDVVLPCVHSFCSACIEQWKAMEKDWCPLCHHPLQLDGSDSWVIPDVIESGELRNYLMSLTKSDGTKSSKCLR
uniref:RING finger protein 141 n=1 Tax=Setaria digitata TaxID=48799 RepID=A0A915PZF8_9BILA